MITAYQHANSIKSKLLCFSALFSHSSVCPKCLKEGLSHQWAFYRTKKTVLSLRGMTMSWWSQFILNQRRGSGGNINFCPCELIFKTRLTHTERSIKFKENKTNSANARKIFFFYHHHSLNFFIIFFLLPISHLHVVMVFQLPL